MRLTCPMCGYENEMRGTHPPSMPFIYTCPKCGNVAKMMEYECDAGGSNNSLALKLIGLVAIFLIISGVAWKMSGRDEIVPHHIVDYNLSIGEWHGSMELFEVSYPFDLYINSITTNGFNGYMVWTGVSPVYRRLIMGEHDGNHLVFIDYEYQEDLQGEELQQSEIAYNKDVYIMADVMIGKDLKNKATFKAVKK